MLNYLKQEADLTYTENGALTYSTSGSFCLDLFFRAGAMRDASPQEIAAAVTHAFAEDAQKTMKIVFFARDIRGGLGERRFFRIAMQTIASMSPRAVKRNIPLFSEYGRYDDLCALLHTPCEKAALAEIRKQLDADQTAMQEKGAVSLLAKWLPSVNASSEETRETARYLAMRLGMTERSYRRLLSALRRYCDILENHLRTSNYSFDYEKQPAGAMFKYRKAFLRNDYERYMGFLNAAEQGKAKLNAATLYPYEIIRRCLYPSIVTDADRQALDLTWRCLPAFGEQKENAIAVIDGSGSMTVGMSGVRPIDAALSLGIYFAEHSKGAFADHFITFSSRPQLVKIMGRDIVEKAQYCASFHEVSSTDLEAVFRLILSTAMKYQLPQEEMPDRLYIISDMEFNACITGGNRQTLYDQMRRCYRTAGYTLPQVVFWNVNSRHSHVPVTVEKSGTALVSGFSPAIFDMVISGNISPLQIMENVLSSERYAKVS